MSDVKISKERQKQISKERQKQMMRQFKRLAEFLLKNSQKFYQEHDTGNDTLQLIRTQIKEHADSAKHKLMSKKLRHLDSQKKVDQNMRDVMAIDDKHGIANRLNMMTLILAHMSNEELFKLVIQDQLNIKNLENFHFMQIPHEVDAILFITNPLLIFDLLNDFLKYRKDKEGIIYEYLTNRIARWLFRFTQFILIYGEMTKMVQLTLLQPKRFAPLKNQFQHVIDILCDEAYDNMMDESAEEGIVFTNDLRRLYMILTHALFSATRQGQNTPSVIRDSLKKIIPVIDIYPEQLANDQILEEFSELHFGSPELRPNFFDLFLELQDHEIRYTFEFLSHIHPYDRYLILNGYYQNSKLYVVQLLSKILKAKQGYVGSAFPEHYEAIITTLYEVVDYEETRQDPVISQELLDAVFPQGKPEVKPEETPARSLDPDGLTVFVSPEILWKTFQEKPKLAQEKDYLMELACLPFDYLSFDGSKPNFHTISLGEIFLLDLPATVFQDFLAYLVETEQIQESATKTCIAHKTELKDEIHILRKRFQLKGGSAPVYDQKKLLQLSGLTKHIKQTRTFFEENFPQFIARIQYRLMMISSLHVFKQMLARGKQVEVHQLQSEWILQLIQGEQAKEIFDHIGRTPIAAKYPEQYSALMTQIPRYCQELMALQKTQQRILQYEIERIKKLASLPEERPPAVELSIPAYGQYLDMVPIETGQQAFLELSKNTQDKSAWFMEIVRIPFRFIPSSGNQNNFILFTLADTVVMNMDNTTRKKFIDYMLNSGQLKPDEYEQLLQHLVGVVIFIKKITQSLTPIKLPQWHSKEETLDFHHLAHLLKSTHPAIQEHIKQLAVFKNQERLALYCLEEVKNWIVQGTDVNPFDMSLDVLCRTLDFPSRASLALEHLKNSSFGQTFKGLLERETFDWKVVCQRLRYEQVVNLSVIAYHRRNP